MRSEGYNRTPNDNFVPHHLREVLSRNYPLTSFTWTALQTPGTEIAEYRFPWDLFVPNIYEKLTRFRYFRAKAVEITVRLNANQFCKGALMVTHLPFVSNTHHNAIKLNGGLAFCRPVTLSAQASEVVKVTIPFVAPLEWLDLTASGSFLDLMRAGIGRLHVSVLTQLRSSNGADYDVGGIVLANFVDPEVAGFIPTFGSGGKRNYGNKVVKTKQPHIEEAQEKSQKGLLSGIAKAVSDLAPRTVGIPLLGTVGPIVGKVAGFLAPVLEGMGLAKPTSQETQRPVIQMVGGSLSHMVGLDPTIRICADNEQSLAANVVPENDWDFRKVAMTPSLLKTFTYNSSLAPVNSTITTFAFRFNDLAQGGRPTYMGAAAGCFGFVRGSMRFKIQLFASTFDKGRVEISFVPAAPTAAIDPNQKGDVVRMIVDVQGDTEVDFIVPHIWYARWFQPSGLIGQFRVTVVNEFVSFDPALDVIVDGAVWVSAGPDVQFACPQLHWVLPLAQSAIWEDFDEKSFQTLAGEIHSIVDHGVAEDEQIYSITSYLKRYERINPSTNAYDPFTRHGPASRFLLEMFAYHRGSVRIFDSHDVFSRTERLHGGYFPQFKPPSAPTTNFEMPYYKPIPYMNFSYTTSWNTIDGSNKVRVYPAGATSTLLRALGDDFELGWLLPPPVSTYVVASFNPLPPWLADTTTLPTEEEPSDIAQPLDSEKRRVRLSPKVELSSQDD